MILFYMFILGFMAGATIFLLNRRHDERSLQSVIKQCTARYGCCKDCRWWEKINTYCICPELRCFYTASDFGCVHWERKGDIPPEVCPAHEGAL